MFHNTKCILYTRTQNTLRMRLVNVEINCNLLFVHTRCSFQRTPPHLNRMAPWPMISYFAGNTACFNPHAVPSCFIFFYTFFFFHRRASCNPRRVVSLGNHKKKIRKKKTYKNTYTGFFPIARPTRKNKK